MKTVLLCLFALACAGTAAPAQNPGTRSPTVTLALEKALNKDAGKITAEDLAGLTELSLPHVHLPSFKDDDFAGLTTLKKLHFFSLFHNKGRPEDPVAIGDKVFTKLPALEELVITGDQLGLLPDDVFAGLKALKVLELKNVTLTRVPKSLLALPSVEVIYYDGKGLSKNDYALLKDKLGDKLKPARDK